MKALHQRYAFNHACKSLIMNTLFFFYKEIKKQSELGSEHIQNRSLELKVEALKQAKSNDEQRKKEGSTL